MLWDLNPTPRKKALGLSGTLKGILSQGPLFSYGARGFRSKAEARKAEAQTYHRSGEQDKKEGHAFLGPVWVQDYCKHIIERSLTVKTVENRAGCVCGPHFSRKGRPD